MIRVLLDSIPSTEGKKKDKEKEEEKDQGGRRKKEEEDKHPVYLTRREA